MSMNKLNSYYYNDNLTKSQTLGLTEWNQSQWNTSVQIYKEMYKTRKFCPVLTFGWLVFHSNLTLSTANLVMTWGLICHINHSDQSKRWLFYVRKFHPRPHDHDFVKRHFVRDHSFGLPVSPPTVTQGAQD